MISTEAFREMALAYPGVTEQPHFDKPSFRVKQKIFATLNLKQNQACLKLSEADQDAFSVFDKTVVFPVPNKWGKSGWTLVNLAKVPEEMLRDAIHAAYTEVAPKKLSSQSNVNQAEN